MGIREPGVKREERNLDPEPNEQSTHQQQLGGDGHGTWKNRVDIEVNGARCQGQSEKSSQDQDT